MKDKLLNRANLLVIIIVFCIVTVIIMVLPPFFKGNAQTDATDVAVRVASSKIQADGVVASENEAALHFQTGGKLVYLPVKEGDSVSQGETIAQLDTYALQRQLTQALNNYKSTRDTFDQTQDNSQNGVLQGQQKFSLNTMNQSGISGQNETDVINDMAKRIIDQNQASLDNSVINVELANYAMQLSSLTSPISGVLTHEDVTSAGVNVSPATTFVIDDPNHLVFKAQVLENDIDYVAVGQNAVIKMASGRTITGTVEKIYPEKITLPTGDKAYEVDIASDNLVQNTKMGETGTVLIDNIEGHDVIQVPTWTILSDSYIWVEENGKPVLKKITIGQEHGSYTEVTEGLSAQDKIIENPKSIVSNKYQIL